LHCHANNPEARTAAYPNAAALSLLRTKRLADAVVNIVTGGKQDTLSKGDWLCRCRPGPRLIL
jgi:hypothetical protein